MDAVAVKVQTKEEVQFFLDFFLGLLCDYDAFSSFVRFYAEERRKKPYLYEIVF